VATTEAERPDEEFEPRAAKGLPPALVRRLSQIDPARATLSVVKNVALLAGAVVVAVFAPRVPVVAAAVVVMVAGQHGLAVLMHEAAHHRLYRTRRVNDLVGKLCAWPMGLSMLTYRLVHRVHHNHLYEPIDPDLALIAGYPRGRMYLVKKLVKDLAGLTTLKNVSYFHGASKGDGPATELRRAAARDRRVAAVFYFALLGASIATGTWRWFLVLWVLPLVTLFQAILRLRAVCEHGAVTDRSTPLRAARTTLPPVWLRWLMFPHQVFYHVEHHLYPSVPHYRLADCHRELAAAGLLEGAEVRSFGATLGLLFAERQT
jgi:fatty acid desaturase